MPFFQIRPLSPRDADSEILAAAANYKLKRLAQERAHEVQQDFVPRRSSLSNLTRLDTAGGRASKREIPEQNVEFGIAFDIVAAFLPCAMIGHGP
eukprot:2785186-Pyramimonas_sp.AAC.1